MELSANRPAEHADLHDLVELSEYHPSKHTFTHVYELVSLYKLVSTSSVVGHSATHVPFVRA